MPQTDTSILESPVKRDAGFGDYLAIARLDHSSKHIFIVPGIVLAYLLRGRHADGLGGRIVLGLLTAVFIASANYVINEWLDRDFDKYHPTKSQRTGVQRELLGHWIVLEYFFLVAAGFLCAFLTNTTMLVVASVFALQGLVYNVPPLRTKDNAYVDVISESINNPLRLMIGWAMIDATTIPPASILLSYWLGGAFLMGAKRLSEYRQIVASHGRDLLVRYRASFAGYTETSLTVSVLVYAMCSSFFLAVFLLKYRVEYILLMPLIIALFGHYLAMSMLPNSTAQKPEKLFRERRLMLLVLLLAVAFAVVTFVNVPALDSLTQQRYIVVQ